MAGLRSSQDSDNKIERFTVYTTQQLRREIVYLKPDGDHMSEFTYTRWFDIDLDGPPVRNGVYEGAIMGTPDSGYQLQPGFYVWQDDHWCGYGSTPEEAVARVKTRLPGDRTGSIHAQNWRGVVPGAGYPVESVVPSSPSAYAGVLERSNLNDLLRVHRFKQVRHQVEFHFQRERGTSPPIRYKSVLNANGDAFVGHATGEVQGHRMNNPTDFRLKFQPRGPNELSVVVSIPDRELVLEFVGQLRR